jgi:hypothetical protein
MSAQLSKTDIDREGMANQLALANDLPPLLAALSISWWIDITVPMVLLPEAFATGSVVKQVYLRK